jgi:hypothetical protein
VPWKNGGGITHEALRVPAAGDSFHWRVSVAQVDGSGPFSDFAGYRRYMTLLEGAGIALRFGDGTNKALRRAGELAEFDGAMTTYGELIDGPCRDLNLIVAKSMGAAVSVEWARGRLRTDEDRSPGSGEDRSQGSGEDQPAGSGRAAPLRIEASPGQTVLMSPIDGAVVLALDDGESATLERWDLAVLSKGTVQTEASARDPVMVFVATLDVAR